VSQSDVIYCKLADDDLPLRVERIKVSVISKKKTDKIFSLVQ